jgi:hypothetical protein
MRLVRISWDIGFLVIKDKLPQSRKKARSNSPVSAVQDSLGGSPSGLLSRDIQRGRWSIGYLETVSQQIAIAMPKLG